MEIVYQSAINKAFNKRKKSPEAKEYYLPEWEAS